jgi:hypothetical protein
VSSLANIAVTINGSAITPDCLWEGSSVTIKIPRSTTETPKFAILVVPVMRIHRPHSDDFLNIHEYQRQLNEHWTPTYEAIAMAMAYRARLLGHFFLFSAFPDQVYSILFPGIGPQIARYRCCLLYLSESWFDEAENPSFDTFVTRNAFLDLSAVIWPWEQAGERELQPILGHLPTKSAKFSDCFFQLCQMIDDAPMQALLDLGTTVQSPGTTELLTIERVLSQLANDMFCDGFPVSDSASPSKLRAFQAFGCLIASHVLSGKPLPVLLDESVIAFAFGITTNARGDIRKQLNAIRSGVYKIELVKPSLRRIAHRPHFCRSCQLRPINKIETVPASRTDHSAYLLSHPMLVPFVRNLLRENFVSDAVAPVNIEFMDEMAIRYVKDRNTLFLPSFPVWMKCFVEEAVVRKGK